MITTTRIALVTGAVVLLAVQCGFTRPGVSTRTWLLITTINGTLAAVGIGRLIADRRARRKPPPDGPEADYHDPPA